MVPQKNEIVMARMAIRPGDIYARPCFHVNFYFLRLFPLVYRCRHGKEIFALEFSVQSYLLTVSHDRCYLSLWLQQSPGGIGLPCGQVCGCPRKLQMRSSSSGLMMCSNLQACV